MFFYTFCECVQLLAQLHLWTERLSALTGFFGHIKFYDFELASVIGLFPDLRLQITLMFSLGRLDYLVHWVSPSAYLPIDRPFVSYSVFFIAP